MILNIDTRALISLFVIWAEVFTIVSINPFGAHPDSCAEECRPQTKRSNFLAKPFLVLGQVKGVVPDTNNRAKNARCKKQAKAHKKSWDHEYVSKKRIEVGPFDIVEPDEG